MNFITEQEKIQWDTYGLTCDQQSMENSAFVQDILQARYKSIPIPCLLDPSEYAQKWLLNYLTAKSLLFEVATQADERFSYKLELAVRFGKILLVTDVERFSPALLSVIVSDTHMRYNKRLLQVGNKLVDCHEDFKLILVTRRSALDETVIRMDVASRITQIPFINTETGFCEQLVSKSICLKRPDLEEQRVRLLKREEVLLEERGRVQAKLLAELSTASGDLLLNESLIKSLNAAKESSDEIDRSLNGSKEVRAKLQDDFSKYRKLCAKVAALFMGLAGTYRIATQTYTTEFLKVLAGEEEETDERIFSRFIRQIYFSIARTIAKSEYTELALLICKNAYSHLIPNAKWEPFITNFMAASGPALDNQAATAAEPVSVPDWLRNKEAAAKVASFAAQLPSLYATLNLSDEQLWHEFMIGGDSGNETSANKLQFPIQLANEFDKVLVTQILRPDLLLSVIRGVLVKLLGFNYMAVVQPTIQQLSVESRCDKPVLILSDPGTDPARELREVGGKRYIELSVAQGQEREALDTVRNAARKGHWVCLKNIHLLPALIRDLETELNVAFGRDVKEEGEAIHTDFRLWVICESLNGFSETFVMKSISVLFELPNGLKLKVQRLLRMWEPSLSVAAQPQLMKLAFALFLFTGVLQERRNFIPQGFTKWYEFADSDLRVAIDFVRMLMARQQGRAGVETRGASLEWNFVQKIFEIVAFGGRLSNDQDLKVLVVQVRNFFRANLFSPSWNVLPLLSDVLGAGAPPVPLSARPSDYHDYLERAFGAAANDVDPQNLGLPGNSRTLQNMQNCRLLLKQLRSAYYKNRTATQPDSSLDRQRIKPILSLWKNLSQVNEALVKLKHRLLYLISCLIPENDHS